MNLSVEIKPDLENTISITDFTQETDEYISEDIQEALLHYYNFKYSQTCTINVVKAITSQQEELLNVFYSNHTTDADSIRVILPRDGFYSVDHLVLPTLDWLEAVKDQDLSEYLFIYVTDGIQVYKYVDGNLSVVDIDEVVEINPERTTISISRFKVFNIDGLKRCYTLAARQILNNAALRCKTIDDELRFNRDFLWMTINVINYYLEWDRYSEAQIVLENIGCANLCPNDESLYSPTKSGCGCHQ